MVSTLCVQTSQGVQPKRFKTLTELIQLYLQPNHGLVTTLLLPVEREECMDERDYSGTRTHTTVKATALSP